MKKKIIAHVLGVIAFGVLVAVAANLDWTLTDADEVQVEIGYIQAGESDAVEQPVIIVAPPQEDEEDQEPYIYDDYYEYPEEPEYIPMPDPMRITPLAELGNPHFGLELPVIGATGWAGGSLPLLGEPRLPPPEYEEYYYYYEYYYDYYDEHECMCEDYYYCMLCPYCNPYFYLYFEYEYAQYCCLIVAEEEYHPVCECEKLDEYSEYYEYPCCVILEYCICTVACTCEYEEDKECPCYYHYYYYYYDGYYRRRYYRYDYHCDCDARCFCHDEYEEYIPVEILMVLAPGQAFTIVEAYYDFWYVRLPSGESGWIPHSGAFINAPDVLPSIVYNITNAYYSMFRSNRVPLPGVYGTVMYNAWSFNYRLNREEFIVPILYATAHRLFLVQQEALARGETVIMYEAFRPRATQQAVVASLTALMEENEYVRYGINNPPWHMGMFISRGISNHQRGAAVDVGLGRIYAYEIRLMGGYEYRHITGFVAHEMPTLMHELHPAAATIARPSWEIAETMTEGALIMRDLFLRQGFSPLSSEWWHFDDRPGIALANQHNMTGMFFTETIYSNIPTLVERLCDQEGELSGDTCRGVN